MEKRLKRKIKNRIWLFSLFLLTCSLIGVITSPAVLIEMLPIMIPTSALTLGIPIYDISKYMRRSNKCMEIEPKTSNNDLDRDFEETDDCIDINSYSKDYDSVDECYRTTQEKNKVKTIGTMHEVVKKK